VGTAHRVTALLASEGLIEVSRGRRATVIHQPSAAAEQLPDATEAMPPPQASDPVPLDRRSEQASQLLDLEIRRLGRLVKKLTTQADPTDPCKLRQLLVDAIKRDGQDESQIAEYEMDIRHFGESSVLTTFVATTR
jgi:hypothetical protein